jgi:signal peptidase I
MDMTHALKCELACDSLLHSGTLRLKVNGWSMIPTIWPGDTLIISRLNHVDIQPGEIVLYRRNQRIFVHRVAANYSGAATQEVVTQGDCMPQADPPVPSRDILGRLDFIVRNGQQIVPARRLTRPQRVVAALVQSSEMGARTVFGVHRLYRNLRSSIPQQHRDESCQR